MLHTCTFPHGLNSVFLSQLSCGLACRYWTWITHLVVWGSVALWFPFLWLYGLVWRVSAAAHVHLAFDHFSSQPGSWSHGQQTLQMHGVNMV